MQLSEIFRRGIVVGKNIQAEQEMSNWFIEKSIYVEFLPILSDELFEEISKTKLFYSINEICNSNIDDYGEDSIYYNHIPEIKEVISKILKSELNSDVKNYISNFQEILNYAYEFKRKVFFIF